ncbi:MAG TPA: rhodanese-like domain-containing protein [Candidatus Limnocylindria bacterium]|jgi:rhodanese-related sulfurtransferase|nr:rhodanese-like domain-containing protein [Candidatus Limnocylindria bacterium]
MKFLTMVQATLASVSLMAVVQAADPTPAPAPGSGPEPLPALPVPKFQSVTVKEYEELRKKPNTVLLDVRTPEEFAKGHVEGATNIDVMATDFKARVEKLDKSKTYLVNCASGVRSVRACRQMSTLDFPSLVNLKGGYVAWEKETKH